VGVMDSSIPKQKKGHPSSDVLSSSVPSRHASGLLECRRRSGQVASQPALIAGYAPVRRWRASGQSSMSVSDYGRPAERNWIGDDVSA